MVWEQGNELAGEYWSGWVWSEEDCCSSSVADCPTHWMPLPKAPVMLTPEQQEAIDAAIQVGIDDHGTNILDY